MCRYCLLHITCVHMHVHVHVQYYALPYYVSVHVHCLVFID